jgi:hypothetical protein
MRDWDCEGCRSQKTGELCGWCEDGENYELDESDEIEDDNDRAA